MTHLHPSVGRHTAEHSATHHGTLQLWFKSIIDVVHQGHLARLASIPTQSRNVNETKQLHLIFELTWNNCRKSYRLPRSQANPAHTGPLLPVTDSQGWFRPLTLITAADSSHLSVSGCLTKILQLHYIIPTPAS